MSSYIGMEECPRCKNETLFVDCDCGTGEYDSYCQLCGCGYHFSFNRDDSGEIIQKDIIYPRKNVVFGIMDFETKDIIWEKAVSDIPNLTERTIQDFINGVNLECCENAPDGIRNLFDKSDGSYKQLFYIGNGFKIVDDFTIVLCQAQVDEEEYAGNGLISIEVEGETHRFYALKSGETKEFAINKFNELISSVTDKSKVKSITATWFNEETNELENLEQK